jgi:hypothetical protein
VSDNVKIAIVSALAALVGGITVAVSNLLVANESQAGENARIERRLDQEAKGAARVLVGRLTTALSYTEAMLEVGQYARDAPRFVAPLPPQDLKLIAARISPGSFSGVDTALRDISSFLVLQKAATGNPFTQADLRTLRLMEADIRKGRQALYGVAGLED